MGELQKVREVSATSAGSSNYKRAKKEKRRQWSMQFVELLLHEFESEDNEEKEQQHAKHDPNRAADETVWDACEEDDCRIVVKGERPVPIDWDSFEVTRDFSEPVLTSELYEDIIDSVKNVGNWKANILYKIATAILADYYKGAFGEQAVGELFYECYEKCVEKKRRLAMSEKQRYQILGTLYEYFARVNARKSVVENEREGRKLVESSGLSWSGTTYYNSRYYYAWMKVETELKRVCNEISAERHMEKLSFADMVRITQFSRVGGLTFHGVFVWIQQKDNHPSNQYGMKDIKRVPPEEFVYMYRNHYNKSEETGIRLLELKMKKKYHSGTPRLWRSFTLGDGREYHNGMSYLLEGSMEEEQEEQIYAASMGFLQNFILYRVSGCVEFLSVQ